MSRLGPPVLPFGVNWLPMSKRGLARDRAIIRGGKFRRALRKGRSSYRRRNRVVRRPKFTRRIARKVHKTAKAVQRGVGTYNTCQRQAGRIVSTVAGQNAAGYSYATKTGIEGVIDALPVWDVMNDAFSTMSAVADTGQKTVDITRHMFKCTVRNNYDVPVKVWMYDCPIKIDTSISPFVQWTNGLADNTVGPLTEASFGMTPKHSNQFRQGSTIRTKKFKLLNAGDTLSINHMSKPFKYDPAWTDSHTSDYVKRHQAGQVIVRIEGVLAHDTSVTTEQGISAAGVDVETKEWFQIKYHAGINMVRYENIDGTDQAFTNGPQVSGLTVSKTDFDLD